MRLTPGANATIGLYSPEVNAQQNSDEQEDNYVVEDHPEA